MVTGSPRTTNNFDLGFKAVNRSLTSFCESSLLLDHKLRKHTGIAIDWDPLGRHDKRSRGRNTRSAIGIQDSVTAHVEAQGYHAVEDPF